MEESLKRKLESNKPGVPAKKVDAGSEEPEHSDGSKVSVRFGFEGSDEIYVLKDLEALKKLTVVFNSFQGNVRDLPGKPMDMKCKVKPGKFILESLPEAVMVQDMDFNNKPGYFQKMIEMTIPELMEIYGALRYHICPIMDDSVAAAIAARMVKDEISIEEIGKLLGGSDKSGKKFKDDWRYPAVDTSKD